MVNQFSLIWTLFGFVTFKLKKPTGLVSTNTTPQLLKALESHKIEPEKLVTHYFKLSEIEKAYEVFGKAADHHAIKVIIENDISEG